MHPADWQRLSVSVQRHEGLRLMPYTDTEGHLTIGFGRNLAANGIRRSEAYVLLDNDLTDAYDQVRQEYPWAERLAAARLAVIVELMFNLGSDRLAPFAPTLTLIERGDYAGAGARLRRTKWYRQVGARGDHLIHQLITGEWWTA